MLARFISPDSIYPDLFDPQALNGYTYCDNNPLMYVDPSGHDGIGLVLAGIATVIISAMTGYAQSDGNCYVALISGAVAAVVYVAAPYAAQFAGQIIGSIISSTFAATATGTIVAKVAAAGFTALMVGGAAGGVQGGLSAAVTGGNILESMLYGAVIGTATAFALMVVVETIRAMELNLGTEGTYKPTPATGQENNDLLADASGKISTSRSKNDSTYGLLKEEAKLFRKINSVSGWQKHGPGWYDWHYEYSTRDLELISGKINRWNLMEAINAPPYHPLHWEKSALWMFSYPIYPIMEYKGASFFEPWGHPYVGVH